MLVGKTLRDYFVLRRLGQGAMAEVYLAQQLSLGRQVALKVLNAELARDPAYVDRFHHEARAAAALVHGGIVQIYEVGQVDGAHYIAQEYVPGRNLGELIRSRGRLDPALTIDILRQVSAALAKAAAEGIVHRDIKPENIMLARSGEVKVADFGLARVPGGGLNLTQVGVTMGTPLYMSPEQIEGSALDSRSDIYSLGVTAYHMLAGAPPFNGDTPLAVAMQHLNQSPESLEKHRPDLPNELTGLVHRMLAKKPADRFADPAALLQDLRELARLGAEQGWATAPENMSLAELIAVSDDRAASTLRLEQAMKSGASSRPTNGTLRRIATMAAFSIALGTIAGLLTRPLSMLAGAASGPRPLESPWAQLYHAKNVDTEAAWQAVEIHFPDADSYFHDLAKQGLAQYYLFRSQEYEKALKPLKELAAMGEANPALSAFGTAGLVIAEAKLGRTDQAHNENANLTSEMRTTVTQRWPQLAAELEETLRTLSLPESS